MSGETVGTRGLVFNEPLIFEQGSPGRVGYSLPTSDVREVKPDRLIPKKLLRDDIPGFPEVSEVDVVRHFTRMSQWNYGIDLGFYPLGSCTMKYNPRLNEDMARLPGFARAHPYQPEAVSQGALQLLWELEQYLAEICGMDRVSLQPSAGAHGELTGIMLIRAYHISKGNPRKKILIPDSAHGTNPASSAVCGYQVVSVKSGPRGVVEPQAVAEVMDEEVAGIMVTNPNTLGIFEDHILEIAKIVHGKGGQVYCDGANLNAFVGIARPGDMGIDVIQLNVHKTFSTPHGGGGPGAGPVAVTKALQDFLPVPRVRKVGKRFVWDARSRATIGRVHGFYGNVGVLVRAFAYITTLGREGLTRASQTAIINANYLKAKLQGTFPVPYNQPCMHEFVVTLKALKAQGITAMDVAKRLLDYGFYAPTVYFPLIVEEAMMIEPTETESKETLDQFAQALLDIVREAKTNPDLIRRAPQRMAVDRLDEVKAAREPNLRWHDPEHQLSGSRPIHPTNH